MSHFLIVFWNLVYFSVYWRQKQNAILDTNLPCILDSQWPFLTSANRTIGKFLDVHWLHRSGLKKYSKQKVEISCFYLVFFKNNFWFMDFRKKNLEKLWQAFMKNLLEIACLCWALSESSNFAEQSICRTLQLNLTAETNSQLKPCTTGVTTHYMFKKFNISKIGNLIT